MASIYLLKFFLSGFGIEFSKILIELLHSFSIAQMLINLGIIAAVWINSNIGMKFFITQSVYISRYRQFGMVGEAIVRVFYNGKIPSNLYRNSSENIVSAISHEWTHLLLGKFLGRRQNTKITEAITLLFLIQNKFSLPDYKNYRTLQKEGNISDLIERGKKIEKWI
jgi:hypothetical protein